MLSRFARLTGTTLGSALLAILPCRAEVRDVELKAAYIYNFAQFTAWPGERASAPLAVCAEHAGALWQALQAYNGRLAGGRPWQLVDAAGRPRGLGCDVLVLGRAAEMQAGTGVLVIRDGTAPGASPCAITLVDDDEQLRFDVDTRQTARAGLRMSSKLLRLARNVL